jgi:hypothetical protein
MMIRSHLVQLLSEKPVAENMISRQLSLILMFVIDHTLLLAPFIIHCHFLYKNPDEISGDGRALKLSYLSWIVYRSTRMNAKRR